MSDTDKLIDRLSTGLEQARPLPNIDLMAIVWLLASALYVVAIIHLTGPIRPGAWDQLVTTPRYLIEMIFGLAAIVFVSLAAFRAAVPGAVSKGFARWGLALTAIWIGSYVVGLEYPTLEPSMLGKRHSCFHETLIYSIPPMIAGFIIVRRLYPLRPITTALGFSLAAGMLPALYMQIACMYSPDHILQFHILPAAMVGLIGAAAAWPLLRARL
ncbi:MAG: NrsF family protein [Pseudomonadota bacterium]